MDMLISIVTGYFTIVGGLIVFLIMSLIALTLITYIVNKGNG